MADIQVPDVCDMCGTPKYRLTDYNGQYLCCSCATALNYTALVCEDEPVFTPYVYV